MKNLSIIFWILAVILSNIMSAVVAYNYSDMIWGIEYAGYSAPVSTAFLTGIPYAIGVVVCVLCAVLFKRKSER